MTRGDRRQATGNSKRAKVVGLALSAMLFALAVPIEAEQPKKLHRVGLLTTGFPESLPHLLAAFKQGLREHGYVEGENLLLELRYGEARAERLPMLAADLVRLKVDVIVAIPNPSVEAVRQATKTTPIVMPRTHGTARFQSPAIAGSEYALEPVVSPLAKAPSIARRASAMS